MNDIVEAKTVTAAPGRALRLWFAVLGPPLVWLVQFQTVYLASEWFCTSFDPTWIHAASIVALIISLLALYVAFSEWRASDGGTKVDKSDQRTRSRFMSIIGIMTGMLFTALIIATWLPTLTGVPCSK
jgi:uncharacterized membrane protein (UPF0182 family)